MSGRKWRQPPLPLRHFNCAPVASASRSLGVHHPKLVAKWAKIAAIFACDAMNRGLTAKFVL
jgi:hypothetical protein